VDEVRRSILPLWRFVQGKLTGLRRVASLYVPARRPYGRSLVVRSALARPGIDGVTVREALPGRAVRAGDGRRVDAAPINALSITDGQLITDGRGFATFATRNGEIISDISEDYRGRAGDFSSLRAMQRPPAPVRLGRCTSLLTGGGGVTTYFHWLYDVLPRLHLFELAGVLRDDDTLIVPELRSRFHRESLELLGIDIGRCYQVTAPVRIVTSDLSATTGHRNHEHVEPWVTRFLAERLGRPASASGRRIYINRRDADLRKLTNESELERALEDLGVASVSLDGLPLVEQIELFGSAELVIAPHGAGLANLAFCRAGTQVVELLGDGLSWSVYEHLARDNGLRYVPVEALHMVVSPAIPDRVKSRLGRVWDARVDVELVTSTIERSLEDPATSLET
jgi:capsular polysaccharide biosynthesis protein